MEIHLQGGNFDRMFLLPQLTWRLTLLQNGSKFLTLNRQAQYDKKANRKSLKSPL